MICASVSIAGCQTTMNGSACDGWEPIRMRASTVDEIARNDLTAAAGILAHNEHGEQLGCWKARP